MSIEVEKSASLVCVEDGWCVTDFQTKSFSYLWTINNFSKCRTEVGSKLESSVFTVECGNCETKWNLWLYPGGVTKKTDESTPVSVCLYLHLNQVKPSTSELFANYEFFILNAKGERTNIQTIEYTFSGTKLTGYGFNCFRNELMEKSNDLLPGDRLTLRCNLSIKTSIQTSSSGQNDYLYLKGEDKLSEDFGFLLDSNIMTDVTLLVKKRKFSTHKIVLSARSPVFSAMFQSQMKECVENKVKINDINVNAFEIALKYMYTGKIPKLNNSVILQNVLIVANKYALDHLKTICEMELCKVLSVECAAQFLTVADVNNAYLLKERTTRFIIAHLQDVVETKGWKLLVDNHPNLEIEIFRASAKRLKTS